MSIEHRLLRVEEGQLQASEDNRLCINGQLPVLPISATEQRTQGYAELLAEARISWEPVRGTGIKSFWNFPTWTWSPVQPWGKSPTAPVWQSSSPGKRCIGLQHTWARKPIVQKWRKTLCSKKHWPTNSISRVLETGTVDRWGALTPTEESGMSRSTEDLTKVVVNVKLSNKHFNCQLSWAEPTFNWCI